MSIITERYHEKRLKKFNINIKTKFHDNNKILERNTNNSKNDDIKRGIILNKSYIKDNKVLLIEKEFNPRILYTYLINDELNKEISCPNCGYKSGAKNFISGCPYCGTYYNIDYTDKNLGAKYHYDRVLKSNKYLIITFIMDLIFCMLISFIYFKNTGRTFTIFDITKILGFGLIGTLLLFYVFYFLDAFIITIPVKIIKDNQNKKQMMFWNEMYKRNVSKEIFFNNLNVELQEFYFNDENEQNRNIIDYDILEYNNYKYFIDNNKRLNIKVEIELREISFEKNNINTNKKIKEFTLRKNYVKQDKLHPGANVIMCHNCGASIDVTKGKCEHCGSKINYLQEWYIIKNKVN